MFRKLLVCADGSDESDAAVQCAAHLARRAEASVDVVHVVDLLAASGVGAYAPEACISEEIVLQYSEEAQQAILRRAAAVLKASGISYRLHAELGQPVDRIERTAERASSDLIVIGSRGMSGWPALLLGSVSEGVARHAPCPVLVVRGQPWGFHRFVLAVDGSEGSRRAARAGLAMAKGCSAQVSVLNIVPVNKTVPQATTEEIMPDTDAVRVQNSIRCEIDELARQVRIDCRFIQDVGHPAERLIDYSEKHRADLIVVGSRGLGGFQRMLLGSVSSSVLHHARCSVLVAR
ncbi:MAG TPA: universal stress protein [Chthonomonadaceae bacterium]|nr:universal stress protein [Chthonomonadaceae bacterium]